MPDGTLMSGRSACMLECPPLLRIFVQECKGQYREVQRTDLIEDAAWVLSLAPSEYTLVADAHFIGAGGGGGGTSAIFGLIVDAARVRGPAEPPRRIQNCKAVIVGFRDDSDAGIVPDCATLAANGCNAICCEKLSPGPPRVRVHSRDCSRSQLRLCAEACDVRRQPSAAAVERMTVPAGARAETLVAGGAGQAEKQHRATVRGSKPYQEIHGPPNHVSCECGHSSPLRTRIS